MFENLLGKDKEVKKSEKKLENDEKETIDDIEPATLDEESVAIPELRLHGESGKNVSKDQDHHKSLIDDDEKAVPEIDIQAEMAKDAAKRKK